MTRKKRAEITVEIIQKKLTNKDVSTILFNTIKSLTDLFHQIETKEVDVKIFKKNDWKFPIWDKEK